MCRFRNCRRLWLAVLLCGSYVPVAGYGQAPRRDGDITAPLLYDGMMLVLVNEDGAAAVVFHGIGDGSVSYDYRFEAKDGGRSETGTRALSERRDAGGNLAGELFIRAGSISIGWSRAGAARGWIYYTPEKVKVHLADARDFADREEPAGMGLVRRVPKLNLQRFLE
jgi:hypothetical protein